ncbi:MAG: nitroreductase [Anaerolineales bacterium]|nr:nitroreductase [Anaerolineales bacterium]MCX7753938.1 nitroreductase [Anaerolineales bacterium]MDW8278017.1 nitroreductase [Anaerolineales bacterium]
MELYEAIYMRQSIGKVRPDPLPRALIEKLLDAGAQAPNHYKVRPWRFVVLTDSARERLGEVMAESFRARFPQVSEEALEKERAKPLRAPVIIAVGVEKPAEPKVDEIENLCAAAAACQNILLAAQAEGLGAIWRTGDAARDPKVKAFLGFAPDQHLIGLLYIGYPAQTPVKPQRPSFEDRTVWM